MAPVLHLERPSGDYADSLRVYDVVVNDEKRGELGPGEQISIDVEPGPVSVFLRLDSGKSKSISLNLDSDGEVRLRGRPRSALTALYRATLGRRNYMRLEVVERQ